MVFNNILFKELYSGYIATILLDARCQKCKNITENILNSKFHAITILNAIFTLTNTRIWFKYDDKYINNCF